MHLKEIEVRNSMKFKYDENNSMVEELFMNKAQRTDFYHQNWQGMLMTDSATVFKKKKGRVEHFKMDVFSF